MLHRGKILVWMRFSNKKLCCQQKGKVTAEDPFETKRWKDPFCNVRFFNSGRRWVVSEILILDIELRQCPSQTSRSVSSSAVCAAGLVAEIKTLSNYWWTLQKQGEQLGGSTSALLSQSNSEYRGVQWFQNMSFVIHDSTTWWVLPPIKRLIPKQALRRNMTQMSLKIFWNQLKNLKLQIIRSNWRRKLWRLTFYGRFDKCGMPLIFQIKIVKPS